MSNDTKESLSARTSGYVVARAAISKHAREVMLRSGRPLACGMCGYSNHVQVCHVKPVHEFEDDVPLSEINALHNLMLLCPNCHWEFDHPETTP